MKLHSQEFQTTLQSFAAQRDAQAEQLASAAETMHKSAVQDAARTLNQMADDYTTMGERFSRQLDPAARDLKYAVQDTSRNIERMREQIATDLAASLAAVNMSSLIGDLVQTLEEIEGGEDDDPSASYEPSFPPVYDDDLYFAPTPAYSDSATGATTGTARSTGTATEVGQDSPGIEREISTFYAQVQVEVVGSSLIRVLDFAKDHLNKSDFVFLLGTIISALDWLGYEDWGLGVQFGTLIIYSILRCYEEME